MDLEKEAGGDGPGWRQIKCKALCGSKVLALGKDYNYANLVSDDSGKTVVAKSGCCKLVALT